TMPCMSRYVLAPMRIGCSFSGESAIQPRYSGPSIPQKPGQPSAAPKPSSDWMKSTVSGCIRTPPCRGDGRVPPSETLRGVAQQLHVRGARHQALVDEAGALGHAAGRGVDRARADDDVEP